MMTVHLDEMLFFARHGLYAGEKVTGANYRLNVAVSFYPGKIESLADTINYVLLYEIIKKRFDVPTKLLETLAQDLAEQMHLADDRIKLININIKKLNPPIFNFTGYVAVTYSKSFS